MNSELMNELERLTKLNEEYEVQQRAARVVMHDASAKIKNLEAELAALKAAAEIERLTKERDAFHKAYIELANPNKPILFDTTFPDTIERLQRENEELKSDIEKLRSAYTQLRSGKLYANELPLIGEK